MLTTCANVPHMKMIQIRNVPDELHRELKMRAVAAGTTLSDYLKERLVDIVERPTPSEWVRQVSVRSMFASSNDIEEMIRDERDRR
jgi:plasmid stability protein